MDKQILRDISGLSITIVLGRYGGFHAKFSKEMWRVCIGWIAFTIYFSDIKAFMHTLINRANKK